MSDAGHQHEDQATPTTAEASGTPASGPPPGNPGGDPAESHDGAAHDAADDGGEGEAAPAEGQAAPAHLDLEALADADPRSKAELLGVVVQLEEERDEYLDDLRRSHADFENYRKRVMRESASQRESGKAAVAEPLLEVLDDLDRTVQAAEGSSDASLAKGVELVAGKLTSALRAAGVQRIDATGVTFDPAVHEAVQQQPAEEPVDEPRVAQVLRPGYALGERTLRAAMVVVEQ